MNRHSTPPSTSSASDSSTSAAFSRTSLAPATPWRSAHRVPRTIEAVPSVASLMRASGRALGGPATDWGHPSGSARAASRSTAAVAPSCPRATKAPTSLTSPSKKV